METLGVSVSLCAKMVRLILLATIEAEVKSLAWRWNNDSTARDCGNGDSSSRTLLSDCSLAATLVWSTLSCTREIPSLACTPEALKKTRERAKPIGGIASVAG